MLVATRNSNPGAGFFEKFSGNRCNRLWEKT